MQAPNRRVERGDPSAGCEVDGVFLRQRHGGTEKYTEKDPGDIPWELPYVHQARVAARSRRRRGRAPRPSASRRVVLAAGGVALAMILVLRASSTLFHHLVAPSPRRSVAPSLTGPAPFTIVMHGNAPSLELSAALRQAVRRRWPGYRLPPAASIAGEALEELRQEHPEARVPYAVAGDFNGDRRA